MGFVVVFFFPFSKIRKQIEGKAAFPSVLVPASPPLLRASQSGETGAAGPGDVHLQCIQCFLRPALRSRGVWSELLVGVLRYYL